MLWRAFFGFPATPRHQPKSEGNERQRGDEKQPRHSGFSGFCFTSFRTRSSKRVSSSSHSSSRAACLNLSSWLGSGSFTGADVAHSCYGFIQGASAAGDEMSKAFRKVSRRSFLGTVIGGAAAGAVVMVAGGAPAAAQVTDRDRGGYADPRGYGRGPRRRTPVADRDPYDTCCRARPPRPVPRD